MTKRQRRKNTGSSKKIKKIVEEVPVKPHQQNYKQLERLLKNFRKNPTQPFQGISSNKLLDGFHILDDSGQCTWAVLGETSQKQKYSSAFYGKQEQPHIGKQSEEKPDGEVNFTLDGEISKPMGEEPNKQETIAWHD